MPMPTTAWETKPLSPSSAISVRMPPSFLPLSTRSLGHLIRKFTPQTRSTARYTATALRAVRGRSLSGVQPGRHRIERNRPLPAGD